MPLVMSTSRSPFGSSPRGEHYRLNFSGVQGYQTCFLKLSVGEAGGLCWCPNG